MIPVQIFRRIVPVEHAIRVPDLSPTSLQAVEAFVTDPTKLPAVLYRLLPGSYVVRSGRNDYAVEAPDIFLGTREEVHVPGRLAGE